MFVGLKSLVSPDSRNGHRAGRGLALLHPRTQPRAARPPSESLRVGPLPSWQTSHATRSSASDPRKLVDIPTDLTSRVPCDGPSLASSSHRRRKPLLAHCEPHCAKPPLLLCLEAACALRTRITP
eukprot:704261-Rhodomonas_salina.2